MRSSISKNIDLEQSISETLLSWCKATGDKLRLDILRALKQNAFDVSELCRLLDCKQSSMSHHLKILAQAGLVSTRREGNSIFYRRVTHHSNPQVTGLQQRLIDVLDQTAPSKEFVQRLKQVQQERAANSLEFFQINADKFEQQQDLMVAYDAYADTAVDLIKHHHAVSSKHLVVEVGPGDGSFLPKIAPLYDQVIAIDTSKEMLEKTHLKVNHHKLKNIKLLHGDTRHPLLAKIQASCIVANMVLHHTPSPAETFTDLANMICPEGQLLITELCNHDQQWATEACGDLWLGFSPEDLTQWATEAGLIDYESVYIAQRNGFRVQIRQFTKPNFSSLKTLNTATP